MGFCKALTERERKAGRLPSDREYTLPTEAQWERACRARTETKFSFGDDESALGEYAWFDKNASQVGVYDHPVGRKKPNPWGFHDMHGNVSEWCRDWFQNALPGGRDPEGTLQSTERVARGGWASSPAEMCRSAFRQGNDPWPRLSWIGFRVALSSVREADADTRGTADK